MKFSYDKYYSILTDSRARNKAPNARRQLLAEQYCKNCVKEYMSLTKADTIRKINEYKAKTGMSWAEISDLIGIEATLLSVKINDKDGEERKPWSFTPYTSYVLSDKILGISLSEFLTGRKIPVVLPGRLSFFCDAFSDAEGTEEFEAINAFLDRLAEEQRIERGSATYVRDRVLTKDETVELIKSRINELLSDTGVDSYKYFSINQDYFHSAISQSTQSLLSKLYEQNSIDGFTAKWLDVAAKAGRTGIDYFFAYNPTRHSEVVYRTAEGNRQKLAGALLKTIKKFYNLDEVRQPVALTEMLSAAFRLAYNESKK